MSLSPIEVGSIVTSIATLVGLVIAFAKLYFDQKKSKKEMEQSKQYLQTLSKLVEAHIRGQESHKQLEKQKFEWDKLKDLAKGLWELAKSEEE